MASNNEDENSKYKLLGFERNKKRAIIMVIPTGKIIKVTLDEVLRSEIIDNLSKVEIKDIYRKYYSGGTALTTYEMNDRNERSWMIYVALNVLLLSLYIFTNIAATRLIYLEWFDLVIPPAVFLYPLTFLVVDLLNETYGLKLARKALLFAFSSNALIVLLMNAVIYLPGLPGWKLDAPYAEVVTHVSSVLVASSVSFLFSEYVNSYLLCKIKELTNSRFLFLRVFLSTFFAVIIDSILFCYIAFYGTMQNSDILHMIYAQIAIKMCFAVFNVFPAYGARSLFKNYIAGAKSN
ncbi:queuosine precursor transporter [Pseudomonas sp. TH39(2020)]|uniref:queuosine precursor transporter n=1 Tax=Pseudomonas sp. TH39(2020) TaxID=2796349 RepID=UPI001914B217|nr:queuosine precursor transporter [Pseudomonas sp. TH39(2020)]MBK5396769.1 queuosine precursor transporter [Pseudomonas sp. TH39(2020)]